MLLARRKRFRRLRGKFLGFGLFFGFVQSAGDRFFHLFVQRFVRRLFTRSSRFESRVGNCKIPPLSLPRLFLDLCFGHVLGQCRCFVFA